MIPSSSLQVYLSAKSCLPLITGTGCLNAVCVQERERKCVQKRKEIEKEKRIKKVNKILQIKIKNKLSVVRSKQDSVGPWSGPMRVAESSWECPRSRQRQADHSREAPFLQRKRIWRRLSVAEVGSMLEGGHCNLDGLWDGHWGKMAGKPCHVWLCTTSWYP